MTHQLTDEQRRLLEDCPREKLEVALAANMPTIEIWEDGGGEVCACTSRARRSIGIPSATVEAWLAEQDEREAEIERRIGKAISLKSEVELFDDWERTADTFFVSEEGLLYRRVVAAPLTAIPVPRARIRAALDKHRADQADHIADASKMVEPDQNGDATEMTQPRRYPDEVGEGPWKANSRWSGFWIATKSCHFSEDVGATFRISEFGDSLAKIKAEQAADELNAIWRREEDARRRDIAHGEALEEDERRTVTISPELRARLNLALEEFFSNFVENCGTGIRVSPQGKLVICAPTEEDILCNSAQARAFLRERGIEVPND